MDGIFNLSHQLNCFFSTITSPVGASKTFSSMVESSIRVNATVFSLLTSLFLSILRCLKMLCFVATLFVRTDLTSGELKSFENERNEASVTCQPQY
jgi:hypothetical protein